MKPRTIEFFGKKLPVYWGMNALHRFATESKYMEGTGVNALMLKIAIEEGARKEGNKAEYSIEEIMDGMDDLGLLANPEKINELMAPINDFLPDSMKGESEAGE